MAERNEEGRLSSPPSTGKQFRARKLDYSRPLRVYREDEICLEDQFLMTSLGPQIVTGVDKEEEEEHHLRAIIGNAPRTSAANVTIPIPDIEDSRVLYYDELYPGGFKMPTEYCRAPDVPNPFINVSHEIQGISFDLVLEGINSIGNGLVYFPGGSLVPLTVNFGRSATPIIPFNITERDRQWMDDSRVSIEDGLFEKVFWVLECMHSVHGESIDGGLFLDGPFCRCYLSDQERVAVSRHVEELVGHWRRRRVESGSGPLIPAIRTEDRDVATDPYVCFRRRELKKPRKTRRSDALFAARLSRLKNGLQDMMEMVDQCIDLDELRKESVVLEERLFSKIVAIHGLVDSWPECYSLLNPKIFAMTCFEVGEPSSERGVRADMFDLETTYLEICRMNAQSEQKQTWSFWKEFFDPMAAATDIEEEMGRWRARGSLDFVEWYRNMSGAGPLPEQFFVKYDGRRVRRRVGRGGRLLTDTRRCDQ